MAEPVVCEEALLLLREPRGDNKLLLYAFSRHHGLLACIQRLSSKRSIRLPDLFDRAELQMTRSRSSDLYFLDHYELLEAAAELSLNYQSLRWASRYALLLRHNLVHLEHFEETWQHAILAVRAWTQLRAPEVVYLKALYLFLKEEGLPVREDWAPSLSPSRRELAENLIRNASPEQSPEGTVGLIEELERWVRRETEVSLPHV